MTNFASCSLFVLVVDRCLWSFTLNNSKKHLGYKVRSFPFKLQESTGRCICYILTEFFFSVCPTTTTVSTVSYLFAALFCCSCCNFHKRFVIVKMHVHVFAHARYTLSLFSCLLSWQTCCYRVIVQHELWRDNSWSLLIHYPIKIYSSLASVLFPQRHQHLHYCALYSQRSVFYCLQFPVFLQ